MANENSRTRDAVKTIMRVFGMWGLHRFASVVEAVKNWKSHKEQQNVIDCLREVLREDPPKMPFAERLKESRSFAIMFIHRAMSILEPDERIRSTFHRIFSSYMQYKEKSEADD